MKVLCAEKESEKGGGALREKSRTNKRGGAQLGEKNGLNYCSVAGKKGKKDGHEGGAKKKKSKKGQTGRDSGLSERIQGRWREGESRRKIAILQRRRRVQTHLDIKGGNKKTKWGGRTEMNRAVGEAITS